MRKRGRTVGRSVVLLAVAAVLASCASFDDNLLAADLVSAADMGPDWQAEGEVEFADLPFGDCVARTAYSPLLARYPDDGDFATLFLRSSVSELCPESVTLGDGSVQLSEEVLQELVDWEAFTLSGGLVDSGYEVVSLMASERQFFRDGLVVVDFFGELSEPGDDGSVSPASYFGVLLAGSSATVRMEVSVYSYFEPVPDDVLERAADLLVDRLR